MKRILWAAAAVQLLCAAWLASSMGPHGIRAALYEVVELSEPETLYWNPGSAPDWYSSHPPEAYARFLPEAKAAAQGAADLEKAVALMAHLQNSARNNRGGTVSAFAVSEAIEQIREGRTPNCAHYSWILTVYLRSLGYDARVMALEGSDRLGGNGHAAVEVWLPLFQKWALLDPTNSAYFLRGGVPLHLLETRELFFAGRDSEVEIVQEGGFEVPRQELPAFYRALATAIDADGTDLISRMDRPYGGWPGSALLFSRLPRHARIALDNLFGKGDVRAHLVDARTASYQAGTYAGRLRGILLFSGGAVLSLSLALIYRRKNA